MALNDTDTAAVLAFIKSKTDEHKNAAVIVFRSQDLYSKLSNVSRRGRHLPRFVEDVNDILTWTESVKDLGDVYTVCERDFSSMYLVAESKAAGIQDFLL